MTEMFRYEVTVRDRVARAISTWILRLLATDAYYSFCVVTSNIGKITLDKKFGILTEEEYTEAMNKWFKEEN